ncbi:ninja-family protein AFP3-like isoform X2 [Salvia hispanica]|uniref:ninja-family protein AFP3-like isoform X2 n=1 Tax=Salvia hispanica TaxID=49212 RepID=UPI0020097934|nr:ninja-family protein AFP3-like isoform X2 [Salvia hispanica]
MEGGNGHRDTAGSSRGLVPKVVRRSGAPTGNAGNCGPELVRTCSMPPEFGTPRMDKWKSVAVHAAANGALTDNGAGSTELPQPSLQSEGNLVNGANQANTTGGSSAGGQPADLIVSIDEALMKSGMVDMPYVSTKGYGPNHRKTEGFLYKYKRGEEVKIVCVCHGLFLTPAEFVRHGGGGNVAFPLKHIVVTPSSLC